LATRQEVIEAEVKLGNAAGKGVNLSSAAVTSDDISVVEPSLQERSVEDLWPVLAVETKVVTNRHTFADKITILVRIPAARGAASRLRVRMLPRSSLTAPSFYDFPSPAVKFQPMEGPADVEDGMSWLTLQRPKFVKNALLNVPEGALLAMCRPEPASSMRTDQLTTEANLQVVGKLVCVSSGH